MLTDIQMMKKERRNMETVNKKQKAKPKINVKIVEGNQMIPIIILYVTGEK